MSSMNAQHSYLSTSSLESSTQQGPIQQEPSESHGQPSHSSLTTAEAPSGTGAADQSATTISETIDSIDEEATSIQQQFLFSHQQDVMHLGAWTAIDPLDDIPLIGNDSLLLSPASKIDPAVNSANNRELSFVSEDAKDQAVGLLRETLHRKV